jgi:hypothetical protein
MGSLVRNFFIVFARVGFRLGNVRVRLLKEQDGTSYSCAILALMSSIFYSFCHHGLYLSFEILNSVYDCSIAGFIWFSASLRSHFGN